MAFQASFLDFDRGIRVGHLEPEERITQILKGRLETATGEAFNIDRFGRGVYWQWICFCPRRNRTLKAESGSRNFCTAKFFISIDKKPPIFKAGAQIERGFISPPPQWKEAKLANDWDWHRLMICLQEPSYFTELERLVREEEFEIRTGSWMKSQVFTAGSFPSSTALTEALNDAPRDEWGALQVYFPMPPAEVVASSGPDLVDAMLAVFQELTPIMNGAMEIELSFD